MQKLKRFIIFIFLMFATLFYAQKSVPQDEIKAKIEIEKIEQSIKVTGTAENKTGLAKSASYQLSVIKSSKNANGNQSNNRQEGFFTLQPYEKIKLSTTQVNTDDEVQVIVMLIFFNEEKQVISKERIEFNGKKKVVITDLLPDESFILRGIITDNTKTRIGKEFYDKYYYKYNDININGNEIVTLIEELSFGRNTKISIEINNEVIYEFLAKPDDEFLEAVAEEAVKVSYYYFKTKEKQNNDFIQY